MSTTKIDGAIVAEMVADALEFCAEKMGLRSKDQVAQALRSADCTACEYLRFGLARVVAEYLGSLDPTVRAAYCYEPERATTVDEAIASPGINLLVWVSHKSAALSSVVSLLRSLLAQERSSLDCPKGNAMCWLLDVQVVDDGEVQSRSGYGALLHSLHVRPLEIWRR